MAACVPLLVPPQAHRNKSSRLLIILRALSSEGLMILAEAAFAGQEKFCKFPGNLLRCKGPGGTLKGT
eukprot:1158700-Pelagomonas_calceolata.AAC.12